MKPVRPQIDAFAVRTVTVTLNVVRKIVGVQVREIAGDRQWRGGRHDIPDVQLVKLLADTASAERYGLDEEYTPRILNKK
jgi:hypothetical protein